MLHSDGRRMMMVMMMIVRLMGYFPFENDRGETDAYFKPKYFAKETTIIVKPRKFRKSSY